LIATNLSVKLADNGLKVLLVDCDVENPNCNILLGTPLDMNGALKEDVYVFKPVIDENLCSQCNTCRDACYRHAIIAFPGQYPYLMEHMCSGCETCSRVCPNEAILNGKRVIGSKYFLKKVFPNLDLLVGELKEGEAISVKIVENLLEDIESMYSENSYDIIVIDTAPGAHCDVEKSLSIADQIICVTEPTPFGEHDLGRILDLIGLMNLESYCIINRANLTGYKDKIIELVQKRNVKLLGEIPLDEIVVENYAKEMPFVLDQRDFPAKQSFLEIFSKIFAEMEVKK
jgi:MinD superfamily P-loop ATPase